MANKTVYPFGTEGTLPSSIGIINDLRTGGADKALAAEQGKVIGNLLLRDVEPDLSTYAHYDWWINNSNKWEAHAPGTNQQFQCLLIPIDGVAAFRCTADGGSCHFAFLKTNTRVGGGDPDFADGYTAKFYLLDGNTQEYQVPSDARYLYIYATLAAGTDILGRYDDFHFYYNRLDQQTQGRESVIRPLFMYCSLLISNGKKSGTYNGTGLYTTPRFVALGGDSLVFTVSKTRRVTFFEYDKDLSYLGYTAFVDIAANTETTYVPTYPGTKYVKITTLINTSYTGDAKCDVALRGVFPDDWDTYNLRPTDSGYMKVMVPVRVTDPTCCDGNASSVQDASQILPDYGVICLPAQYTHNGKPTRLIIYCHGAAVNYADNASRFNSQDLDPTYWLAEGYAVMDIEGNPFDNTNEHICIPQAMDCYVAAYKWAIEYFNLCRDGVFLGGRSMGGQNTFNLMRRECPIPVIAACPNSAAPDLTFGYSNKTRKTFISTHMGFVLPSGFEWEDGECDATEKQVLSDNWDKYIKCCPELSACVDLPSKETLLENMYHSARKALWETLHMVAKCPVKLFGCNQDPSCPPAYTTSLFYRMLMNAGQIAECRLYNTSLSSNQHHYDTQDPNLRTTITTSYGDELTNVPIVYIEMLAFWRRYEQGL